MITVTIWHNVAYDSEGRHSAMLDGYRPGDPMVRVFTYQADPAGRPPEEIAEEAFDTFNDHPRNPEGEELARLYYRHRLLRSLSKGDVVVVGEVPLAAASAGWTLVRDGLNEVRADEHGTHPLRCPAGPRAAGRHLSPGRRITVNEKKTVTVAGAGHGHRRRPGAGRPGRPVRPAGRRWAAARQLPVRHGCRRRVRRRRGRPGRGGRALGGRPVPGPAQRGGAAAAVRRLLQAATGLLAGCQDGCPHGDPGHDGLCLRDGPSECQWCGTQGRLRSALMSLREPTGQRPCSPR
jgi:hypothetical protein